jgi:protein-L-isoaspartate(D-aspartate) O-methyltransferase
MKNCRNSKLVYIFTVVLFISISAAGCIGGGGYELTPTPSRTMISTLTPEFTAAVVGSPTPIAGVDDWEEKRQEMVDETILARGVTDEHVIQAMQTVPRHEFVPEDLRSLAYEDHPLPIGYGQTISQPYIVAWMTELLELKPGEKVLEIGTGSGYQAAVLAELGYVDVYSIEIVPELAEQASNRLDELGYDVQVMEGDGYYGWDDNAPFDAIIVTAAPDHLPAPLVEQLSEGGRIVVPIGPRGGFQSLWKFVEEDEELVAYNLGGVSFVPFTGEGISGDNP